MRPFPTLALALALPALLAAAPSQKKPKKPAAKTQKASRPSTSALQAQVAKLAAERDDLKAKLAALTAEGSDLADAVKSRDLAREEAAATRKELERLRATLQENKAGGEDILKELQAARAENGTLKEQNGKLAQDLEAATAKLQGSVPEGGLVAYSPDILPARPINLNRVTPKVKKVDRGVVVVNVLVNESGEVLQTRLLQGLPGDGQHVQAANEACVEAAKRLVFEPARAKDGTTRVKVWQGVGFHID
jgi:predicted nuclease with TOPRIM domain